MTATILVVEDNDDLRELCAEILLDAGHGVLAAHDGAAALELARRHPGEVNLVITDMVMPGMSGTALMEQLRVDFPALRVLLMSGHWQERSGDIDAGARSTETLQKPFTAAELLAKVELLLGPAGTST